MITIDVKGSRVIVGVEGNKDDVNVEVGLTINAAIEIMKQVGCSKTVCRAICETVLDHQFEE